MRAQLIGITLLIGLLTLAGCGGGSSTPQPNVVKGTLQGAVYTSLDGQTMVAKAVPSGSVPVYGATVSVRGYSNLSTVTDSAGEFTLPEVPVGPQHLEITSSGTTRREFEITVNEGVNPVEPLTAGTAARNKWTVLVYMGADNNLEPYALKDLNEMEAGVSNDPNSPVEVYVQMDRSPVYDSTNGDWSDTRRFHVTHDTDLAVINSTRVDNPELGEVDMANPQALKDFISWGQQQAPAEHYVVIVWNHGSGWDPEYDQYRSARAISIDDSSPSGTAIRDIDLSSALDSVDPIDVFSTDACLMMMVEVAYQIRHVADYFVASEELTPAEGFDYTALVNKLVTESDITPAAYAVFMAENNFETAKRVAPGYQTQSPIDLTKLDAVAAALDALSERLIAIKSSYPTQIHRAWVESYPFGYPYPPSHIRDLSDYAANLALYVPDSQLRKLSATLQECIRVSIVNKIDFKGHFENAGSYSQYPLPEARGLSIYLPTEQIFNMSDTAYSYRALQLSNDTHWNEWLAVNPD